MTTTADHCIAAIGLNAYRLEQSCHDFIILLLPVRLCASVVVKNRTGFIGIWQPEARLNNHAHIHKHEILGLGIKQK